MVRHRIIGSVVAALVVTAVSAPAVGAPRSDVEVPATQTAPVTSEATGVIVRTTASDQTLVAAVDDALPQDVTVSGTTPGVAGLSLVSFDSTLDAATASDVAADVKARRDVTLAVPNYRVRAFGVSPVSTDDPFFERQRNLWDATIGSPSGGYSLKAPSFWPTTRGSSETVVAVLDSGVVLDHPDLAGQLVPGYDFVDDEFSCSADACENDGTFISAGDGDGLDPDPSDPGDWIDASNAVACGKKAGTTSPSSWHGTHVAGIIAAKADNGIGTAGVAPGVRVQPVRVLGHCGGTTFDIVSGLYWAAGFDLAAGDAYFEGVPVNQTPADVVNLSLGSTVLASADRRELCDLYGSVVADVRGEGTTVVAASGNDSFTKNVNAGYSVPAACPGVISVGATSRTGHRAWYSQAGASVDISAPGGDTILDRVGSSDDGGIWSTLIKAPKQPTGAYTYAQEQGTSVAAPHVAAAAALLYSSGATDPARVESVLRSSVSAFPARSKRYAAVKVTSGSTTRTLADLNCTTSTCGTGVLDLSRFRTHLSGTVTVGRTLTARGWRTSRSDVSYAWRVEGTDPVLATTRTFVVPKALLGKRLAVTVANGDARDVARSAVVARSTTTTRTSIASKVKKSAKPKITVTVSAPLAAAGTVTIYDGRKRLVTKRLTTGAKGKAVITLPKLKKGKHSIRAVYSGDRWLRGSSSSTRTVTSR